MAWHQNGSIIQNMQYGELFLSDDIEKGRCFFQARPRIYVHNMRHTKKPVNYIRFTPLCDDGIIWSAKWEVKVDKSRQIHNRTNEQWVQAPGSVRLVALRLCGYRYEELPPGVEVSRAWNPALEAHPNPPQDRHTQ